MRPQDIKLSVQDFKFLILSQKSDSADGDRVSKLVGHTTGLFRDSFGPHRGSSSVWDVSSMPAP